MTLLRALILTASLSVAATDPLAPYVFVAGVEGTGHHWFTSFFGKCKKAGECESSDVGILEWQWVIAQIKEQPDAARFAVRAAAAAAAREAATGSRALRVLNTMGTGRKPDLVEEYRRSNITIICSASLQKKEAPNCGKFTDGEQSYPNYGGPHKPEQMPEMGFLATALGAHGQLRVVVLTRDAAAIAASVCDHRHFGGPGPSACAKELELLSKAARLIAAQVAALPATVLCDHYDQEDLTDATRGGLARLGAYLEIDAPTFAAATNAGHAPSKPEPPHPERDALVAALKEAQEGAAAACRARGAASSEAKLDAAVAKLDSDT
mmetsp:Transcript_14909/g.48347  ORF Transcript_14909/g.48347 Transcript_14909/m.48347 type:complete len:323 (+) Transcript_14909:121-1089(+)